MEIYACKALKMKSLNPSSLNLHHLYMNETNNIEPILFITSAGSDPSIELENFAIEIVSSNKFKQLAMAGGNTQQALELIETAAINEINDEKLSTKIEQQIYNSTHWLPNLEKCLKSLKNIHFKIFVYG